jgi:hypothetical protein
MSTHLRKLSPEEERVRVYRTRIVEYWKALWHCEDSGGTTWDVLEELSQQVTECLARGSPQDVLRALELTARAECLRSAGGQEP